MPQSMVELAGRLGVRLAESVPLAACTTFQIGGPARYFAQVQAEQLPGLVQAAGSLGIPWFLLGNGSNLLVRDAGFDGLVLRLTPGRPSASGNLLTAPGGALLSAAAVCARQHGLSGLEFAQGIPGSVGGGVCMNAGAYGGQISAVLTHSRYIDLSRPQPEITTLDAQGHAFDYRHSFFIDHPACVVIEAQFALEPRPEAEIAARMADLAARRREKQPLEYPSAGSIFKRPPGHFAGQLIEQAGLKGFSVGDAQVSEKHAGFIINRGRATCRDVLALIEHIRRRVLAGSGIELEPEVRLL